MDYYLIVMWRECLKILINHDTCGTDAHPNWYHGNYWWTTGEYINKIEFNYEPPYKWEDRYLCEQGFIGLSNPKMGEIMRAINHPNLKKFYSTDEINKLSVKRFPNFFDFIHNHYDDAYFRSESEFEFKFLAKRIVKREKIEQTYKLLENKLITKEEFDKFIVEAVNNSDKKNIVYTAITKDYDSLKNPSVVMSNTDYICFTDDENLKSEIWEIRPFPKNLDIYDNARKIRHLKLLPHLYFYDYNVSIWVDSNLEIKGDFLPLIVDLYKKNIPHLVMRNDWSNCVYDEAALCLKIKKDKPENIVPQIQKYQGEGYPKNNGLTGNSMLVRIHSDERLIKVNELWWKEILNHSHRDQLSFNYSCWKHNFLYGDISGNYKNNDYYIWHPKT